MKKLKSIHLIVSLLTISILFSCEKTNLPTNGQHQSELSKQKSDPTLPYECFDRKKVDLTKQCEDEFNPVCACEAITFTSPCEAEKHGFINYEMGNCVEAACVNEEVRRLFYVTTLYCPVKFEVCGCNGVTYESYCKALGAGVTSWTPGACNRIIKNP